MAKRILLIQLRQLGDILLTTPCVHAVRQAFPDAHISFLAHKMGKLILDDQPDLNELLTYNDNFTWADHWRLIRRMRNAKFDLVIDFMNNPRSSFLCVASGAPRRFAFESARSVCYTQTAPRPSAGDYIVREKFSLLALAGCAPSSERLLLPWSREHAEAVVNFAKKEPEFLTAPYRVIISPTHRREARQWPLERYATVADTLSKQWGAFIMWAWGPGEESVADACVGLTEAKTYKMPPTNFREMAAFISNHDLFIGNSNGPSHVAVAGDVCSLQLHGPTRASSWCPLTDKHQGVESPYEFGDPRRSMDSIATTDVLNKLHALKSQIDLQAMRRIDRPLRLSWNADAS